MAVDHNKDIECFYGQNGEDFLINLILKNVDLGFFVEVGCIDGLRFSNTLFFEKIGWSGICIEAHGGYIELLKENRKGSIVVHAAVGEKDEDNVNFYANDRGSLSTLDGSKEQEFRDNFEEYFSGFELQKVNKRTLNSIFKENNVTDIHLLSIDIEGYEVEALKGLDFTLYDPLLIVVESDSRAHRGKIEDVLIPHDYVFLGSIEQNLFYSKSKEISNGISNQEYKNIPVMRTAHPVDQTDDELVLMDICLELERREKIQDKIKRKLLKVFKKIYN